MQTRSTLDEHAAIATPAPARTARHYLLAGWASMAGTTIEWYDFFLYGTAAALVFNRIFFPSLDPSSARSPRSARSRSASSGGRWAASCSAISATASAASRC